MLPLAAEGLLYTQTLSHATLLKAAAEILRIFKATNLCTLLHMPSGASHPWVSCSKCNMPLRACSN